MKLQEFKALLSAKEKLGFELPNGEMVPAHFHVTEVGKVTKSFIDCGGVLRDETVVNFQLWEADDYDHRLHPEKLIHIIDLAIEKLDLPNAEIEVEYQAGTIGKFGIETKGENFVLTNKLTNCLAPDKCGIPSTKPKMKLQDLSAKKEEASSCCSPSSGCC